MSFVYVLIFVMRNSAGEGAAALELKEYSTFEACITVAKMAQIELSSKRYPVAKGKYRCLAKPA